MLAVIPASLIGVLIILRLCGMVRPFHVPTGAMAPAVSPGDHVFMEGLSYLGHKPRRGDIVVFRTDGIASLPEDTIYVKRVAGEPGDHLRISDGNLFINEKPVTLSNELGRISYLPSSHFAAPPNTNVTVAAGNYFVLGDNSTNSSDSRYWGSLPAQNVMGRICFCYWPPQRIGFVK